MIPNNSISRKLLVSMSLVVATLVLVLGGFEIVREYRRLNAQVEQLSAEELAGRKEQLRAQVAEAISYIDFKKSQIEERVRRELAGQVRQAHGLISHLYGVNRGIHDRKELEAILREALRPLRFSKDRGYFFIFSMDGTVQLHAARPELERKNLLTLQDEEGTFVIREMISLARSREEGFVSYRWPKPGRPAGQEFEKISFIAYFPQLDWLIGAGEYLDDMEQDVKGEVLARVESIRFGKGGYVFAGQWDGHSLTYPAKGKNALGMTDAKGVKVVEELIGLAKKGGGFLQYVMPKLGGERNHLKISYVQGVPAWQWYVGAGMYLDDIEADVVAARQGLQREIFRVVGLVVLLTIAAMGFGLFLVRRMAGQIQSSFGAFESFFDKATHGRGELDSEMLAFKEFRHLADAANHMLAERRFIEDELREKEQQYRSIYTNIADALIILAADGRIVEVNPAARKQYGYSDEEFAALAVHDFAHPDSRRIWAGFLAEARETGFFFGETTELRKDGTSFLSELTGTSIMRRGRQHLVAIVRDVSERKKSDLRVRKSEEKYRALIETTGTGFVIIDSEGRVRDANDEYVRLSGHARQAEILGRRVTEWTAKHDLRRNREAIKKCYSLGAIRHLQIDYVDAGGKVTPVEINATVVQGDAGPEVITICRDVSGKKQLEEQLRQAQKMEAIGTLAGGIAHDFNNILAAIIGYAEIAKRCLPASGLEEAKADIQEVLKAGMRAKELVKQILAFSRRNEQERKPIFLQLLVKEALKLLRASLPTSIEIRQEIAAETGAVLGDPTNIHQILVNLCTNAFHAMEEKGGILTVTLKNVELGDADLVGEPAMGPGSYVLLRVGDTGCGIEPELLQRIFDPYFTTKEVGKGSGLGLAVVHGIVKSYGGMIKVASSVGRGTVFEVYLPQTREGVLWESSQEGGLPFGQERILFVDDEQAIAEMGKAMLSGLGYRVTAKTDPVEALEEFQRNPQDYDLLVTDQTMPNISGIDLIQEVRAVRPGFPVVLCTGYSATISEEKAVELGVGQFVMKPLTMRGLAETVRAALSEHGAKANNHLSGSQ
ncbi:cache domain-containing protein [Thiovibrio sp. JS02]